MPTAVLAPEVAALERAWQAAPAFVETGTPLAQTVGIAGRVAAAAAAAAPLLVLGAGLLGFEIGTQLQRTFAPIDPPAPLPSFPFSGGQAEGQYSVTVEYQDTSGPHVVNFPNLKGRIVGTRATYQEGAGFPNPVFRYAIVFDNAKQAAPIADVPVDQIIAPPQITSVTQLSGTPSDQKPLPTYPPSVYAPDILRPKVPFPFLPGSPELPVEIVPFRRAVPTAPPDPNAPEPETEPGQEERPQITVLVPDLGVAIDFNPNGVRARGYNPFPYPTTAPQTDPRIGTRNPPTNPPCDCECDLDEVNRKLNKLLECDRCDPTYIYNSVGGAGNSLVLSAPDGVELVSANLDCTSYPANVKSQYGGGVAPDVKYLGWFAWTFGGKPGVRTPIHYAEQSMPAPSNCDGIAITWYLGAIGVASLTYRRKGPPEDPGV